MLGFTFENDLCALYRQHLVDWWQNSYTDCLVSYEEKVWFVKVQTGGAIMRNCLAGFLARGRANIAEVRSLDKAAFSALKKCGVALPADVNQKNTCLVRFAPDYDMEELPRPTLDSAMAWEIAFSIWIRRRDAHSYNRSFVNGIPVFYDHQTAFLGEKKLRDVDYFFRDGPDPGYAGLWKLEVCDDSQPDTLALRTRERECFHGEGHFTALPVHDVDRFHREMREAVEQIAAIPEAEIRQSVLNAGFRFYERPAVVSFLLTNQKRLEKEVALLQSRWKRKQRKRTTLT